MNKHFFKKKSTLSFIEKLRRRNYNIKSRKNISFFYIFERRLLIVLGRLYLTRISGRDKLRFLIENGFISVDNETVKNPLYLTQHRAIIRVIKTLPIRMSKVPKKLIINNLRWLYYKRARKAAKKKPWEIVSPRRAWYRPKRRGLNTRQRKRAPKPVKAKQRKIIKSGPRLKTKRRKIAGVKESIVKTQKKVVPEKQRLDAQRNMEAKKRGAKKALEANLMPKETPRKQKNVGKKALERNVVKNRTVKARLASVKKN
jgi:hypothetical protein